MPDDHPLNLAAWETVPYEGEIDVRLDGPRGQATITLGLEDVDQIIKSLVQARNQSWPAEKPLAVIVWTAIPAIGANACAPACTMTIVEVSVGA